jgi:hypothetical protein
MAKKKPLSVRIEARARSVGIGKLVRKKFKGY